MNIKRRIMQPMKNCFRFKLLIDLWKAKYCSSFREFRELKAEEVENTIDRNILKQKLILNKSSPIDGVPSRSISNLVENTSRLKMAFRFISNNTDNNETNVTMRYWGTYFSFLYTSYYFNSVNIKATNNFLNNSYKCDQIIKNRTSTQNIKNTE